ncbi:MAG: arsenate reductase [Paracoccaceae bacterium]|jgi:arsenate reductase
MIKLYGIKNCDTVRRARKWLEQQTVQHEFVDFRDTPLSNAQLQHWHDSVGDDLLNKRSTTWKQLNETEQHIEKQADIIALLAAHPTLIKRPVLDTGKTVAIGFSTDRYSEILQSQ